MADNCDRENPIRAVDWRWLRATGFIDGSERAPSRVADLPAGFKWIRAAIRFARERGTVISDSDLSMLKSRRPAIYWAHQIWDNRSHPLRAEIEARILARQDDHAIGFHTNTSPRIIEAYEALFFHVRDLLHRPAYILHTAIGPSLQRGLSEREFELLWKLFGYFYGPYVLNDLVSKCTNPMWCATPDNTGSAWTDNAIGTLKMKAALAVTTVPVNQQTQLALMDIFTKFIEVERTTDTAGKAHDQVLDSINAMLHAFPLNVSGLDPTDKAKRLMMDTGPMAAYDASSVEVSYAECLKISTGQRLPNERQLLSERFPEPPERPAGGGE